MKFSNSFKILLLSLAPITASATIADFQIFNTGVDSSGNVLTHGSNDQHFEITSGPITTVSPIVFTSAEGFPVGPWVGDNTTSAWITPSNQFRVTPGDYIYKTTFDLSGFDANTAHLTGVWTSDNDGLGLLLNGNPSNGSFVFPNSDIAGFSSMDTTFDFTSGFIDGINTLYFKLNNLPLLSDSIDNPSGLRVEFDIHTAELLAEPNPVPLPAAFWLFASGLLTLAGYRRKSL